MAYCITNRYVILSHLRSKEFQRLHLPCKHLEISTLVYIRMYPRKVVALQKSKPLSSKQAKPWCGWGPSVGIIAVQIKIDCGNKSLLMWWKSQSEVQPEIQLKQRHLVSLLFYCRSQEMLCKSILLALQNILSHFKYRHTHFTDDTLTLQMTQVNPEMKLTFFSFRVYIHCD